MQHAALLDPSMSFRSVYLAAPSRQQGQSSSPITMMKTGKRRRPHQQQSGRPVLLTLYIARPTRDHAATASAHHRLLGSGHDQSLRRGSKHKQVDGTSYNNRRAELLEYSRQLRALAAAAATTQPAPPPRPRCRDTKKVVGVVREADQRAAENRLSLTGRWHERARSQRQQQMRLRCFGGWSWKRVLVLVFPFNNSSNSVVERRKSKRQRRRGHDDGKESNRNNNQKGWPASLLLGRPTVSRASRDHSGLSKKLMSVFRQRS